MLKKTIAAFALTSIALIAGPPAVATAATISSASTVADSSSALGASSEEFLAPAVWVWGATGLIGVGAMTVFGATAARSKRRSDAQATPDNVTSIYA